MASRSFELTLCTCGSMRPHGHIIVRNKNNDVMGPHLFIALESIDRVERDIERICRQARIPPAESDRLRVEARELAQNNTHATHFPSAA